MWSNIDVFSALFTNYVPRGDHLLRARPRAVVGASAQTRRGLVLLLRFGFRRGVRGGEHGAKLAEEPATWRERVSLCLRGMEGPAILARHVTSSSRMIVMLRKTHRCIRMSCAPYGERACGTAETERWGVGLEC